MNSAARSFDLDPFQHEAIEAFDAGDSVLVAAPTGSGKTVIAEHAITSMLRAGRSSFYTSPIKALANQKYRDFRERLGSDAVGLLTGDVTVNGDAPVVIMTTEVLRNMLYERASRLRRLGCVVLDEVHYLQDRERGPVWEEVLLNLPADVRTVSLSATVSNLGEFVDWLDSVRGPTTLIEERHRPVPLHNMIAAGDREKRSLIIEPLLEGTKVAKGAQRLRAQPRSGQRNRRGRNARGGRQRARSRWTPPRRDRLTAALVRQQLAPLIWFIFSRAGCDEAVDQLRRTGVSYTTEAQRDRLRQILDERTREIDDESWFSLELDQWQAAFERGIASHHAGLVPAAKEAVEVAFAEGLITVVFATETLALGVNLPARTVVLERLVKYDGTDHKLLTPMEFTQLTGRAGRRGIDVQGTAVSCWNTRVGVDEMAELALSRDFELRSAFTPNYNMVANLVRRSDRTGARRFVARSFAQYQVDQGAVRRAGASVALERQLAEAQRESHCEHGDVAAWLDAQRAEKRADDDELGQLRPGAVIAAEGTAIVLSVAHRGGGVVVRLATRSGHARMVRAGDVRSPIATLGQETLPAGLGPNDDATLIWARTTLRDAWPNTATGVEACPSFQRHLDALREVAMLERRLAKERTRSDRRTGRLERRFDAVSTILDDSGFIDDWALTDRGHLLTQVHGAAEIVVAEALADGTLDHLDAPSLAATASSLVYEQRRGVETSFRWPTRQIRHATTALRRRADHYRLIEIAVLSDPLTAVPDAAMVATVHGWATGQALDEVLPHGMTGGDFVRMMRQVIDLCRQIAQTDSACADTAADAAFCLDHGVVRTRRDLFLALDDDPGAGHDGD